MTNEIFIISSALLVCFTLILGLWFKSNQSESTSSFWKNNSKTPIGPLVATIVATQVGSGTILGITSSTAKYGTGFGFVAMLNTFIGFIVLALLAPKIKRKSQELEYMNIPSLFLRCYGRKTQLACAIIFIISYLCLLSGQLLGAQVIFSGIFETDSPLPLITLCFLVIIFTSFSGLKGDIISDNVLFIFMSAILFAIVTPAIFLELDVKQLLSNIPADLWSPLTFGGPSYLVMGLLLGPVLLFVLGEMWMRIIAAGSAETAKKAFFYSSVVFLPFYLLPLFIGLLVSQMHILAPSDDFVLISFLEKILPNGLFALSIAGLIIVILTTVNTMQLVISETVFNDIVQPSGHEKKDLILSKFVTFVSGAAALALSFLIQDIVQLILAAFFVLAVLFPAALVPFTRWHLRPTAAFLSIACGASVTIALLPSLPHHAFILGTGVALIFAISDLLHQSLKNRQRTAKST